MHTLMRRGKVMCGERGGGGGGGWGEGGESLSTNSGRANAASILFLASVGVSAYASPSFISKTSLRWVQRYLFTAQLWPAITY